MSDKIDTAVRSLKVVGAEITQWENRLEFVKSEVQQQTKAKEALIADIERKSADYNIFIAQRDAESKKIRQSVLDEHAQLEQDKAEFQTILHQFQKDRVAYLDQKKTMDSQNTKHEAEMNNIREFVIAVQRACSLIGI